MTRQYLVRAKLGGDFLEYPKALPVIFGDFQIDRSPNSARADMLREEEQFGPDPTEDLPKEDFDYPMSHFIVDSTVNTDSTMKAIALADEKLERMEALLRLYQEGNVFVRRHNVWPTKGSEIERVPQSTDDATDDTAPGYQVKPDPVPLYTRPGYDLGDERLSSFREFFDRYWPIVSQRTQPLDIAISRFSSSYERRTLGDRLIDLIIAMEALFGSKSEVAYKIALRSSCLTYPPNNDARVARFRKIKEVYNERSRIVHGTWSRRKKDSKVDEQYVDLFEGDVRRAVVKWLELRSSGVGFTLEQDPDKYEEKLDAYVLSELAWSIA